MIKYVQSVCTYCISVYGGDTYTVFGSKPEQTFNMMHVDAENKNTTCIKQSFLKIVNEVFLGMEHQCTSNSVLFVYCNYLFDYLDHISM